MDLTPPPPRPISLPPSVMHYFSPLESDAISGNFIFREKEIPLRGYATFDRLQLITQPQFTECAVSFTSERLLMSQTLDDIVVGWGVERKYISAIENCGLFSKSVRLILKDPTLQKKDSFELKFPEENFPKRKNAFITILKMLDLCQACEEDRLEDFQILLQRNLKLVNRPIDSKENTLLIMACAKNKSRIARHLLTVHGIDINKTTELKVIRNGEETTEVYGALYYACINNMDDVVKKMLSISTIDVNTLYTNRLTALQYAIMKDILAIPSNPNSVNSYANIVSLLMSSQKTTWKIAGTGLFAIPTQWMLNTTDETRMAILSCERANELPANLKQMLSKSITEKLRRYRRGEIVRMDSKSTIVSNATEEDATEDTFTLPPNKTTHVFISYAWATDEDGRDNHFRVKYLNDILKKRGIITWFDSDRIQLDTNSLRDTLAKALYSTCCVLICITRQYEVKVNGGDESDFCLYELNIASTSPTLANVRMPVVMERSMLDISKWEEGRMRAEFGHKLYTDLSNDDKFEEKCEKIVQEIIKMLRLQ